MTLINTTAAEGNTTNHELAKFRERCIACNCSLIGECMELADFDGPFMCDIMEREEREAVERWANDYCNDGELPF